MSNVVRVDFGKRDDFFEKGLPVYEFTIQFQPARWLYRLFSRRGVTTHETERGES